MAYDASPAPRRAHDVICVPAATAQGPSGQRHRRIGPKAQAKWLTGSVTAPSEQVIQAVFDHAEQRDPSHRRTWWCWSTVPAINWTWSVPKPPAAA